MYVTTRVVPLLCFVIITYIDIYFFKVFYNVGFMKSNDISSENSSCCSQEKEQCASDTACETENTSAEAKNQIAGLQAELETCKTTAEQWQQRFIQVSADMQNYKRRMEKEELSWGKRAQESLLIQLLPVVDDFERALAEQKKYNETQEFSAWIAGFEMIAKEFIKFLKNVQVTEMQETTVFDPELHEAVAQVESSDVPSGDIVQVVQKGYMFGDQVLRPAKVTVAR